MKDIFRTSRESDIEISSIDGICNVFNLEEFENYQPSSSDGQLIPFYLCRADYSFSKNRVVPAFRDLRPRYCYCYQPANPDLTYLQCELCKDWYHVSCCRLTDE